MFLRYLSTTYGGRSFSFSFRVVKSSVLKKIGQLFKREGKKKIKKGKKEEKREEKEKKGRKRGEKEGKKRHNIDYRVMVGKKREMESKKTLFCRSAIFESFSNRAWGGFKNR